MYILNADTDIAAGRPALRILQWFNSTDLDATTVFFWICGI